jgi:lipopolysaccharide/colanic/teichoic acid biosynthesis glycosyltransferase
MSSTSCSGNTGSADEPKLPASHAPKPGWVKPRRKSVSAPLVERPQMPDFPATHQPRVSQPAPTGTITSVTAQEDTVKSSREEFAAWPFSARKRAFDVVVSAALLIVLAPLMLLIAAVIRLTSRGPVVFCRARVGRRGQTFPMLKFRSMVDGCDGPKLTCKGDDRVTFIGRILRKFKLDELPQIINVLLGQMSMVGPRPHLPEVFAFRPEYKSFLELRPGITGAATVRFHREEETLKPLPWAELRKFYIDTILPEKVRMEVEYAEQATFWTDLKLIMQTAIRAFVPIRRTHTKFDKPVMVEKHTIEVRPADKPVVESGTTSPGEEFAA